MERILTWIARVVSGTWCADLGMFCMQYTWYTPELLVWWLCWAPVEVQGALLSQLEQRVTDEWKADAWRSSLQWKQWAAQAVAGAGRQAHRWLKGPLVQDQDPCVDGQGQTGGAGLNAITAPWFELWAEHEGQPGGMPDPTECEPLPEITVEMLDVALARYPKNKCTGGDQWPIRVWLWLTEPYKQRLLQILLSWERKGCNIPVQWAAVVVLIPKGAQGVRPLAMTSGPIRLWGQLRKVVAQVWEAEHRLCAHVGERYRTCSIVFGAHGVKAEAARYKGHESAGVWRDISKAYERIRHSHILSESREYQVPMSLWRCTCRLYTGARVMQWRGQVTDHRCIAGGALPGCPLAITVTKIAVHRLILEMADLPEAVELHSMVDDLSMESHGVYDEVASGIVKAVHFAVP
eukprot:3654880-Amphidinium_carterae.1